MWGIVDLRQGKLISYCRGRVLGTRGPLFSGQKVTEKALKQECFMGPWVSLTGFCPFDTAMGVLGPKWSKGKSIFEWL